MLFTKVLKRFCGNWLFTLNASNLDSLSKKGLIKTMIMILWQKRTNFPTRGRNLRLSKMINESKSFTFLNLIVNFPPSTKQEEASIFLSEMSRKFKHLFSLVLLCRPFFKRKTRKNREGSLWVPFQDSGPVGLTSNELDLTWHLVCTSPIVFKKEDSKQ